MNDIKEGTHEYLAVNFLGLNYSVLNITVHSVLCEFRYRVIEKPITEVTESEIYKMIFDPKSNDPGKKTESAASFIMKNLRNEVKIFSENF